MKSLLAFLACLALVATAQAQPRHPAPEQMYEITSQILLGDLAVDSERNPEYAKVKKLKEELEIEMGVRTNDSHRRLLRIPTPEDLRKLKGWWRDKRGAYMQAVSKYNRHLEQADRYYNKAVRLSVKYFSLQPARKAGDITNGPLEVRGKPFEWRPRFAHKRPDHLQDRDLDGGTFAHRNAIEIYPSAFHDLGRLAATIRHEQIHYMTFMMTPDEYDMRNRPDDEAVIAELIIREQSVFRQLPPDFFGTVLRWAVNEENARLWRAKMLYFDPYDDPDAFKSLSISEEREREIVNSVKSDLIVFMGYDDAVGNFTEDNLAGIEWIKSRARSDFFKGLSAKEFFDVVKGWKHSRDALKNQERRIKQMVMAGVEWEVQRCGFTPILKGSRLVGFQQDKLPRHRFHFNHPVNVDAIKVSMLVANACIGAHSYDGDPGPPCNDGLEVANMRWADPSFRQKVDLWSTREMVECVDYLRKNLALPADPIGFKRTVLQARAEYDRRWPGGRDRSPGGTNPRQARPPANGRESEREAPGLDFSRAEDVLKRARNSIPR